MVQQLPLEHQMSLPLGHQMRLPLEHEMRLPLEQHMEDTTQVCLTKIRPRLDQQVGQVDVHSAVGQEEP